MILRMLSCPISTGSLTYDLTHDVLPDGAITNDYLHSSDVKNIARDCLKHGDTYSIRKTDGDWVAIEKFLQFASVQTQLKYLVDHDAIQRTNKFCVIGQKDGAYLAAFIYWKTEDQLIFWHPNKNDMYDSFAVANSYVDIDLNHGLRNKEDAADRENEMQRSYAKAILKACQKSGQNFTINKS